MTASTPGSPTWVDLGTSDLDDATGFYTALFDWTAEISDAYTTFHLHGQPVAGAGPLLGEGQTTAWSTYFATADADRTAALVAAAGGRALVAPFDVLDQGRMAAFLDPAGAPFSVWQAFSVGGAALFDVPGALTWNELNTRDLQEAGAFYGAVFGWEFHGGEMIGQPVVAGLNGSPICGLQPMDGVWPVDMPAHWLVYFATEDCDLTADRAEALGGRVLRPPTDLPAKRYAVLSDPQGGIFAVLAGDRR